MWWMLARMAGWDGGTDIPSGTWLGLTTDWNDDVNWPAEIPTTTTDVIISSSVSKQPFVFDTPTAICNNLTIEIGSITYGKCRSGTHSHAVIYPIQERLHLNPGFQLKSP